MLSKLIKYDLKTSSAQFVPWLICALALNILLSILNTFSINDDDYLVLVYSIVMLSVWIINLIVFVKSMTIPMKRFKSCTFSSEAYLMLTIPVNPIMHLISKLIMSLIWSFTAIIMYFLSMFLMAADYIEDKRMFFTSFVNAVDLNSVEILKKIVYYIFLFLFIQLLSYTIAFMTNMTNTKNKGLMSFLFYFAFFIINTFFLPFFLVICDYAMGNVNEDLILDIPMTIYFAIWDIIFFLFTANCLRKKINLE